MSEENEQEVEQEVEQPNYVEDFIDNVIDGTNNAANDSFQNIISLKVSQALDNHKQELSQNILNQKETEDG
jgi:hypothetical protein|tara:strand:- start:10814 stop:11026 length:213 start_codon:yes stop_codon:yes gene_type:complete